MPVSRIYTACLFLLFIALCTNTIIIVGSWNKNYSDLIDNNNLNGGNSVCFHTGCIYIVYGFLLKSWYPEYGRGSFMVTLRSAVVC